MTALFYLAAIAFVFLIAAWLADLPWTRREWQELADNWTHWAAVDLHFAMVLHERMCAPGDRLGRLAVWRRHRSSTAQAVFEWLSFRIWWRSIGLRLRAVRLITAVFGTVERRTHTESRSLEGEML